jgi:serine/threonine protein phosphatase PrpC/LysM repeat protein
MKFSNYSETNVGLVRKANEDSYADSACLNDAHAFVVCDGMGGHVGGATASSMAVKCILEFLSKADLTDCEAAIRDACNYANMQVYATAVNDPNLHGMGTTCVVLVVKGDHCYFGHVGDSRLYIYTNKELHRLTRDQSFVQMLVDKGEISDDQAESHPKKNQILQAIGIGPEIKPATCEVRINSKKGDKLMLCTDGLNGMINDKLIASAFRNNDNLKACAGNLIQLALENGGRDNVTVSLIEITDSPHASSLFKSENPAPSAPGTDVFEAPPKIPMWKKLVKKYKIHLIAGGSALCALLVGLVLLKGEENPTPPLATTETTQVEEKKTITISEIEKMAKEELDKYRNTKIEGVETDTTFRSEKDPRIVIQINKGVFADYKISEEPASTDPPQPTPPPANPKKDTTNKSGDRSYTVKNGDTLESIAKAQSANGCKVTADNILDDNNKNSTIIKVGDKLKIICH